jgi:hypothetical protein
MDVWRHRVLAYLGSGGSSEVMANLFISYPRESRKAVEELVDDLRALDHNVWHDGRLTGGQPWWDKVLEQIRDCDVFLYAMARETFESSICQAEWRYAHALGRNIVPVLVAAVSQDLLETLPLELTGIHYVDYRACDKKAVIAMVNAIGRLPLSEPLPSPPPDPPKLPTSPLAEVSAEVRSPEPLSERDQWSLVGRLEFFLSDVKTREQSKQLLQLLKNRRELIVNVDKKIVSLLGSIGETKPAPVRSPEPPQPVEGRADEAEKHFVLGIKYAGGDGVPQDHQMATHHFREAATLGHVKAQVQMGSIYEGYGGRRSLKEAERWYRLAATQGDEAAGKGLQRVRSAHRSRSDA